MSGQDLVASNQNDYGSVARGSQKRYRSSTNAYVDSLLQDIALLHNRLRQAGQEPPEPENPLIQRRLAQPATSHQAPEKVTTNGSVNIQDSQAVAAGTIVVDSNKDVERPSSGATTDGIVHNGSMRLPHIRTATSKNNVASSSQTQMEDSGLGGNHRDISGRAVEADRRSMTHSLFSPYQIVFDRPSGRVQYFCPTKLFKHYFNEYVAPPAAARASRRLDKHTYRILADVPVPVHDYLMSLFWTRYNDTFPVIDRKAFCNDLEIGDTTSYSGFLHILCLAMGLIFADKKNSALRTVTLRDNCSVFYREVKYLLNDELEDPQGLTTIQAMLILSDLECALGTEDVGGLYASIACRLAFDYGLNLEHSQLRLSPMEIQSRRRLLRACVLIDKGWSLYLGRPTSIKNSDLDVSQLADSFSQLSFGESVHMQTPSGSENDSYEINNLVYDAMLRLTEIACKVQEKTHSDVLPGTTCDEKSLVEIAALGSSLNSWAARLPAHLRWTPENARKAPSLFFIMHQQFHTTQALLHGPYGQFGKALQELYSGSMTRAVERPHETESFLPLARSIASKHASEVVQIFASHRARFGRGQFGLFPLTHAATAILVLTADAALSVRTEERDSTHQRVGLLLEELREMASVYQPAGMMTAVMGHYLRNTGVDLSVPSTLDSSLTPSSASGASKDPRANESEPGHVMDTHKKRQKSNNWPSPPKGFPFGAASQTYGQLPWPKPSTSHMLGEAKSDGWEVFDDALAELQPRRRADTDLDATLSGSSQIPETAAMTSSWASNPIGSLNGGGGPQTQDYASLLPTLLSDDSFDAPMQHNFGSHPGDVFLGYQGEEFGPTLW